MSQGKENPPTEFPPIPEKANLEPHVLAEGVAEGSPGEGAGDAIPEELLLAVRGAQAKKGEDLRIFDLRGVTSLTEYFLLCSGTNQRQNQAISDEILKSLKDVRSRMPMGVEGYDKADWILMDYGDFIVHVLSSQARKYYDLERLWRQARECPVPEEELPSGHPGMRPAVGPAAGMASPVAPDPAN